MYLYNIYFSPTSTTARVAKCVAEALGSGMNAPVTEIDVTRGAAPALAVDGSDVAVIAAPVYGGRMAPIAKERMSALTGADTPCVLVCVYGNRAFENALTDMAEFARSRGFVPVAAAAFVGEHSYSTALNPIAVGRPDADDMASASTFGAEVASRLNSGVMAPVRVEALTDEPSPAESLEAFRDFVRGYAARQQTAPVRYLPELNPELCERCGECVAACPVQAIDAESLAVDPAKCIKCCACVRICPAQARTLKSPFAPVLSRYFAVRKSPRWLIG